MKNTHLHHPEDSILTGDLSILDWFSTQGTISTKYDGAPAIVWGTNPATGNQFVGTKSVFNKRLIKINETHADIDLNHEGNVADILHHCLDNLPDFEGIIQGDFIGYGGDDTFTPNTITYVFPDIIKQNIIVAPHTLYATDGDLKDAYVINDMCDVPDFVDTDTCKFVQPKSWCVGSDIQELIQFARVLSTYVGSYPTDKVAAMLRIELNKYIREGKYIEPTDFDDPNLIELWLCVQRIKDKYLKSFRNNGPKAYIGNKQCGSEGYVLTNEYGMFKLVNREQFSRANFANNRFDRV